MVVLSARDASSSRQSTLGREVFTGFFLFGQAGRHRWGWAPGASHGLKVASKSGFFHRNLKAANVFFTLDSGSLERRRYGSRPIANSWQQPTFSLLKVPTTYQKSSVQCFTFSENITNFQIIINGLRHSIINFNQKKN